MTDNAYASFNINEMGKVRLTPAGVAERRRQTAELNKLVRANGGAEFPLGPYADADGFYHAPLWMLMQEFGHLLRPGELIPFEDGRIWIEIRDI